MGLPVMVTFWEKFPFTMRGFPLMFTLPLMVESSIHELPPIVTLPETFEYPKTRALGPT
jgi:hypothetical protein